MDSMKFSKGKLPSSVLASCLLAVVLLPPDLPAPQNRHIEAVPTRVGQQGKTVEVLIQGNFIEDPQEIIFYRPGIQAIEISQLPDVDRPVNLAHSAEAIKQQVTARFVIEEDCPIGQHQFKLRTGTQLSTLSTFWVTPYPVYKEGEPEGKMGLNDTWDIAEALPPETVTVHGKIDTGRTADQDCYRVRRRKGERISVEVDSVRLTDVHYGESEFDLAVRILNGAGEEIAAADDSALHIQDPILSVVAPEDGDYIVEIRQSLYKGSRFAYYLAHIGDFERPLVAFPAGGEAGKPLEVTFLGDPTGDLKRTIELPAEARSGNFHPRFGPSSLPMRVSPYPNAREGEGRAHQLPIALNGVIAQKAETDVFRITAKQGETYTVRVFGRSLGTPIDPRMEIVHLESGEVEATGDDAEQAERGLWAVAKSFRFPSLLDPAIVWTPEHNGEYEIRIRDMRGLGGPQFVYRIEVEPVENAVHTYMYARVIDSAECSKLTAFAIPQGNRWTLNVRLAAGLGNPWKGDVRLVPEGLPEGIQMNAPIVSSTQNEVPFELVALPGTQPQAGTFRIRAEAVDGTPLVSLSQQAMPFLSHSGARAWNTVVVDRYAYAVTNPAPFRLDVEPPPIPLSKNGQLQVKVRLHREPGFTEPVEVNAYWVPNGITAQPAARFEEGETELEFSFQANSSAAPATWTIALQATTLRGIYFNGVGDLRVSSPFFDLVIDEPYVELASEPASIRRNAKGAFTFRVTHKKPFAGEAQVVLLGLPKGVTAEPAQLRAGETELVFQLLASEEALLGQYRQLSCEITVQEAGQAILQRSGNGVLRVDPALSSDSR